LSSAINQPTKTDLSDLLLFFAAPLICELRRGGEWDWDWDWDWERFEVELLEHSKKFSNS